MYDWNLAIDRIISIKETKGIYQKNDKIDWQEYFEDIIGVTKPTDAEPEVVVLHFIGKTGKYMETKPIHGSQKSKWMAENTLEVTLNIILNYELERLIISYAESVKVVHPSSLIKKIKSRLKLANKLY